MYPTGKCEDLATIELEEAMVKKNDTYGIKLRVEGDGRKNFKAGYWPRVGGTTEVNTNRQLPGRNEQNTSRAVR